MNGLVHDLRFALRSLVRSGGFAAITIATLALGVVSSTAIFSVVNAVMIRPLPGVREPQRLLWIANRLQGRTRPLSYPDYQDQRAASSVNGFSGVAAFDRRAVHVAVRGEVERTEAELVSGNFFRVLGVAAATGRVFTEEDETSHRPLVVLSYAYWQRRFGGRDDALGEPVIVNGRSCSVAGVAARDFSGLDLERFPEVYLPLAFDADSSAASSRLVKRDSAWLGVIGRLADHASAAEAGRGVSRVAQAAARERSEDLRRMEAVIEPLRGWIPPGHSGELIPLAAIGFAASGLVLLIAAANVANMLLGRSVARIREIAVRTALGASRGRIVRLLLTESLILSLGAAAAALAAASWGVPLLLQRLATPPGVRAVVDRNVLLFSLAIAVATGLAFGLAPATAAARRNLAAFFQARQGELPSQTRLQRFLVVGQVSLSLLLLSMAGLFLRSLEKASSVDIGLDRAAAHEILSVSFDLETQDYPAAAQDRFHRELLRRTESIPGVSSAALAEVLPLSGRAIGNQVLPADLEAKAASAAMRVEGSASFLNAVSPGYFATLRIPLLGGRDFTFSDTAETPRVVIVNERFARRFWPGESPIGKRVLVAGEADPAEIVGVARDGRYVSFTERPRPFVYFPILQRHSGFGESVLLTRTTGNASLLLPAVRDAVRSLDRNLPLFHARTLAESIDAQLRDRTEGTFVVSLLGAMSLLLAAGGLYSVVSYSVSRRSQEIGIRMALGASRSSVARLFLNRGVSLAGAGIGVGLLLSAALTRLLTRVLFGIEAADALTFAAVAAVLAAVALAASWIPARRAARLDPNQVLRNE